MLDFLTLIDSGSSDNFMDSQFVTKNNLTRVQIPPVRLRLLDGTMASTILETVLVLIVFPSGETLSGFLCHITWFILQSYFRILLPFLLQSIDWLGKRNTYLPKHSQACFSTGLFFHQGNTPIGASFCWHIIGPITSLWSQHPTLTTILLEFFLPEMAIQTHLQLPYS